MIEEDAFHKNQPHMDLSSKPIFLPSIAVLLFFACSGFLVRHIEAASGYSNLVYNSCANQTLTDPIESYSQTLSSLLGILTAKSLHSSFFKGSVGDDHAAFFGLFQCRGDLSNANCYNCVSRLPALSKRLCGESLGARVQLSGCYIQYEADGVAENSEPELLYKLCSETEARGSGFEEMRTEAFAAVEMGVKSSGNNGFYQETSGEVNLMAQCQRDLDICECGECVTNAVQVAQEECKSSVSGQIYMGKCSLSYTFYPNGIPSTNPHHGYLHLLSTPHIWVMWFKFLLLLAC